MLQQSLIIPSCECCCNLVNVCFAACYRELSKTVENCLLATMQWPSSHGERNCDCETSASVSRTIRKARGPCTSCFLISIFSRSTQQMDPLALVFLPNTKPRQARASCICTMYVTSNYRAIITGVFAIFNISSASSSA